MKSLFIFLFALIPLLGSADSPIVFDDPISFEKVELAGDVVAVDNVQVEVYANLRQGHFSWRDCLQLKKLSTTFKYAVSTSDYRTWHEATLARYAISYSQKNSTYDNKHLLNFTLTDNTALLRNDYVLRC
jgi:hypothetical protein